MTVVDVHAHYLARELLDTFRTAEAAERMGVAVAPGADGRETLHVGGRATNQAVPLGLCEEEGRLAAMDAAGVDVQLMSSWMQLHGYTLPVAQGLALARALNDSLAAFVARHPERLAGAGTVPLQDAGAAVGELERTAAAHGFAAVQIGTRVNERELDDPALDEFWAAAAARRILVLVHPFDPSGRERMRRNLLELVVGFPGETAIAGASLLLGGVFERHPGLRVSLAHGGGYLPFQLGRLQRGFEVLGARARARLAPAASLGGLRFDSILHSSRALAFLIAEVGVERVLLGSDYPFNMGEERPLEALAGVPDIDDAARAAIAGGNAAELLGLTVDARGRTQL